MKDANDGTVRSSPAADQIFGLDTTTASATDREFFVSKSVK
jgi:hypothetical protein